jgi:lipid II:glycine glycyltransferase (peptidoglycan interpeptide bridge formation enzyme)
MSIQIVRSLQENQWRQFVDEHPAGNIFQTPEMFQVFSRAKGHSTALWAAIEGERVLALFTPVRITLMGGLFSRFTTRDVAYGSVLYTPNSEGKNALSKLLTVYKQDVAGEVLFTEFRNLTDLKKIQPTLQENGFRYEDHLNYLIDLKRPPDDILQSFSKRTRKQVRRGLRKGDVVVEEIKTREELSVFYQLLYQTYQNAQVPLAHSSLFEAAFALLHSKEMIRFVLAKVDQAPVATSVELFYKGVIYGWYGGVDRAFSAYTPNEVLMWHILKSGAQSGYEVYDFGGAGTPDEDSGIRDFKAKFGGQLVCYGRNTYVHAPLLLKLSELGYTLLRRWL